MLNKIENAAKATLSLGAIMYVWGFLVISMYLSQFNVLSINALRLQHILAGIWLIVPILFILIIVSWLATELHEVFFLKEEKQGRKGLFRFLAVVWKIIQVLLFPIGLTSFFVFFLEWLSPNFISGFSLIGILDILKVAGFSLVLTVSFFGTWFFLSNARKKTGEVSINDFLWGVSYISITVFVVLGYTLFFAQEIYPKIPATVGGGQPIRVKLMLVHDSEYETLSKLFEVDASSDLSTELSLLTTTDEGYIVLDPSNKQNAISLPKDNVALLFFESK